MVTVYRMRGEHRDPYTEQLWWEESYARASSARRFRIALATGAPPDDP